MIQPKPFKYLCPKCGYSKIIKLKSDVIDLMDMINTCPKCGKKMKQKELTYFDNIMSIFK